VLIVERVADERKPVLLAADVDALYAKLLAFGATILDAPSHYPRYNEGRGYYAIFFADPDGLKLEYVWTAPP